jgi:hypothetical protein
MINEAVLKETIMQHLIKNFGNVETERFISSIIREPFDYTKWREDKFNDVSIKDVFDELKALEMTEGLKNC